MNDNMNEDEMEILKDEEAEFYCDYNCDDCDYYRCTYEGWDCTKDMI